MVKKPQKHAASSAKEINDPRFARFQSELRYKLPGKHTKTKVDARFASKLKSAEFAQSSKVDRYGRKVKSDQKKKVLQNLYEDLDEDEDDGEEEEHLGDIEVEDDDVIRKELKKAEGYDPARGGGFSSSDSASDSDEEDGDELDEADAAPTEAEVETGEVTKRIAVVNLDWDHIKSEDLFTLFSSFTPKDGGSIERVSIYPSEFGKERMRVEEMEGPPKELFKKGANENSESEDSEDASSSGDEDDSDDDEKIKKDLLKEGDDADFDSAALRAYQLDRLRYYYAVVYCSDLSVAESVYKTVDGREYATSGNFLDLRFVPDDVEFDDEPRDTCDSMPSTYKPTEFTTSALQHSKVKLTWDSNLDEASRRENIQNAFTLSRSELEEVDLRQYLASDSDDDEDDDDDDQAVADGQPRFTKKELARQKIREAFGLGAGSSTKVSKSEAVGEMEMTFTPGEVETEGKKKKADTEEETTIEKYKRKEKERKARRKEKALAKREGVEDNEEEDVEKESADQQEDLGFDDPFFTMDEPVKTSKSAQKKEDRLKKREAKQAEAAEKATQRAQLEQIMDDEVNIEHLDHFNMAEIARSEKQKGKKSKKKKKTQQREDRGGLQEGFQINTNDDRFKAIYEDHNYSIDPSNPKFSATPGMKKLLEETRKRRIHGEETVSEPKKKKFRTH